MATDIRGIIQALLDGQVEFIVVGGAAGQLLGAPIVTYDLDICYARHQPSLERLALVLRSLEAEVRGAPSGLPFRLDALTLKNGDSFTFTTRLGDLDILGTPSGTTGYDDLVQTADWLDIDGMSVRVASLDDLIRMKRAAGRTKDLIALEHLGALRDELDRREPDAGS